jgi:hypothetical protein
MDEQEIAFGVWQRETGARLLTEVRDVGLFRAAIGDELIVGLAQMLGACSRIDTCLCLIALNDREIQAHDDRPETAHLPDSIRANRARLFLTNILCGVFHEVYSAVGTLQSGGLTVELGRVKDTVAMGAWKNIRGVALAWRTRLGAQVRNEMAFHLGSSRGIAAGLKSWPRERPLTLFECDRASRADYQANFSHDLLFEGLGFTEEDFRAVLKLVERSHDLTRHAMRVFWGLLHAKGAPIPAPSVIDPPR